MMRLGISLQEGYLIILATLIVLQGAGTIYGLWAQGRAATPEAVRRLAVANSRVRMGWWLIIVFTVAWWWGMASLVVLFAIFSFFLLREFIALTPTHRPLGVGCGVLPGHPSAVCIGVFQPNSRLYALYSGIPLPGVACDRRHEP